MVNGRKAHQGEKRKFDRHNERHPKPKKVKFNFREASYIKERKVKNEEIEKRRKMLEEEKAQQQDLKTDFEDEQADHMKTLLCTFSSNSHIESHNTLCSTETESSDEDERHSTIDNNGNAMLEQGIKLSTAVPDLGHSDSHAIVSQMKQDDEEDAETAQEDVKDSKDPFSIHLCDDLDDELYSAISSVPQNTKLHKLKWPILGNIVYQIPVPLKSTIQARTHKGAYILDKKRFTQIGMIPSLINTVDLNKLYIKSQIQDNFTKANYDNIKDTVETNPSSLTPLQKELFTVINNYQDLYYPERSFGNAAQIRFVYCLHAINHVLKTRTKILHHNAKLGKMKCADIGAIPDEYRDQGLVRPKVLIIVPFRHSCLKIVELLISILIGEDKGGSVINKKRFMEDFSGKELALPRKNPKPEDYELTFQGNTDDTFKIGIAITKKTLKLYSEFYSSDIIISSVLGLRMLVGAEGEEERDYDFLASVELLIMDQSEIFFMQNWDHLLHVLNHLHLQPKESHGTDFSRVRSWCVNGWAKYYRQTIIFSSLQLPEIHSVFNKKCFNYAGKAKVINPISSGSICQIVIQVPLIFQRFEATSHTDGIQSRFEFFMSKILPQYKDTIMNHTLIFIPSYFDFVRLRNYFKKEVLSFVHICEYSRDAKVARARDMFFHSDAHYLLYSERYHFFRRIRIKGIRHIIFYAPPTFPHFYNEMCNLMQEANQNPHSGSKSNMTVTTLYCKYDSLQLAGIIGSNRANKMLTSEKSVHMLVTGA